MKLYHVVIWSYGSVVDSVNIQAESEEQAIKIARIEYPTCTPSITMTKEFCGFCQKAFDGDKCPNEHYNTITAKQVS